MVMISLSASHFGNHHQTTVAIPKTPVPVIAHHGIRSVSYSPLCRPPQRLPLVNV
jgi:hypothetical protein